jgi:hypothetical protein
MQLMKSLWKFNVITGYYNFNIILYILKRPYKLGSFFVYFLQKYIFIYVILKTKGEKL